MNLSIQKRNLRFVYYIVLIVLSFMLMTPGVMLPSILRIVLLILIFSPVVCNIDEFPFVFVTFYGISSVSFSPILPTSEIYYITIVVVFYLLKNNINENKFLIGSFLIYSYFLISSLLHLDYNSSLTWFLIAILICDMIRDEQDLMKIFYSFIIISIFLSVLFFMHRGAFMEQYGANSQDLERSTWINPNIYGGNIAIGGILSIAYLTNFIKITKTKFMTIVCATTFILTFIALILNASRGALLAFSIPSVLMLIYSNTKMSYKLLFISIVCIFIVFTYTRTQIFDLLMIRMSEDSVATGGGRTEIWELKIEKFLLECNIFDLLFGIGETASANIGRYVSTHNDLVTAMIAYGIIGLLMFLYFIFIYPIVKAKNNKLFVFILLIYMIIECCVLEPFFRGYIVFIMFYFFIIKFALLGKKIV